jgi:uncharacterized membrane protein YuzA (DUF378 family)
MNKNFNMHPIDRALRIVVGVFFILIGFFTRDLISDPLFGMMLGTFGLINVISSVVGVCPVYLMAGISTLKKASNHSPQH